MVGTGLTVGGWFAGAVVRTFVNKARSIMEEHHKLHGGAADMLFNVETSIHHIQAVLDVAERRPITNPRFTMWVQRLKDVAYEAENFLDDLEIKRIQIMRQNKVSAVLSYMMKNLALVDKDLNKLQALLVKLDRIAKEVGTFLDLLKLNDSEDGILLPPIKPVVYGRDEEKEQLLNIIFPDVPLSQDAAAYRRIRGPRFVCIVGAAGVGKTTLAQVIYNNPHVKEAFHLRGWIFISHKFGLNVIFKNIIRSFGAEQQHFDSQMSLEPLQTSSYSSEIHLSSIIQNKRFFLVLDDAQENLQHIWTTLKSTLAGGATESMVLVTTRSKVAAESIEESTGAKDRVMLGTLPQATLWAVLKHHAFGKHRRDSLESVGKKIADKLHGLPLLAEAIGRLLRQKLDEEHWQKVSESPSWDCYEHPDDPSLPSVAIIFEHLGGHLRNCLSYCSMFPSGYLFEKNRLVQMWIGNSLQQHGQLGSEDAESQLFDELFNRSLVQPTIWKDKYTMNAVIRESVAAMNQMHQGFYTIKESCKRQLHHFLHLAVDIRDFVSLDLRGCSKLQTILFFDGHRTTKVNEALASILPRPSVLRVLDLSYINTKLEKPPDVINGYSHLRFLDLSFTGMQMLPSSLCRLYHLQVLGLRGCQFKELPRDINELVNLRYLYAEAHTISLIHKIGQLNKLQGLEEFAVSEMEGHRITELKDLNELGGQLCIGNLEKVTCAQDASDVELFRKKHIKKLMLKWQPQSPTSDDCMQALSHLKPNANLEELEIQCYSGFALPAWIAEEQYFTELRRIQLTGCERLLTLPPLGQLYHLEILILQGLELIQEIGGNFYGTYNRVFPALEELKFHDMPSWEKWLDVKPSQTIPKLRKIEIKNCERLSEVPISPLKASLKELEFSHCNNIFTSNPTCLEELNTLKRLKVDHCSGRIYLPCYLLASLEILNLQNCEVEACYQEGKEHIHKLRKFLTIDCREVHLTYTVREDGVQGHNNLASMATSNNNRIRRAILGTTRA